MGRALRLFFILTILSECTRTWAAVKRDNELAKKQFCCQTPKGVTIEPVTTPFQHAEGPHWDAKSGKLYFVDTRQHKIHSFDPKTGDVTHATIAGGDLGVIIPVHKRPNNFIVTCGRDILLVIWNSDTNCTNPDITRLTTVEHDRPKNVFNDGKVDNHGRLWTGTKGEQDSNFEVVPEQASLYLVKKDCVPEKKISSVTISNGIAWNEADDKMYFVDTGSKDVVSYDYNAATGSIKNKRIILDVATYDTDGIPDGMTIDREGYLWVALFRGGKVLRIHPKDGRVAGCIHLPFEGITSAAFGGPKLDILYVTTSNLEMTTDEMNRQPEAGSIFAVTGLGVRGYPGNSFKLDKNGLQYS